MKAGRIGTERHRKNEATFGPTARVLNRARQCLQIKDRASELEQDSNSEALVVIDSDLDRVVAALNKARADAKIFDCLAKVEEKE